MIIESSVSVIDVTITVVDGEGSGTFHVGSLPYSIASDHCTLPPNDFMQDDSYDIEIKDSGGFGRFGRSGLRQAITVKEEVRYKGQNTCYLKNCTKDGDYSVRIYF